MSQSHLSESRSTESEQDADLGISGYLRPRAANPTFGNLVFFTSLAVFVTSVVTVLGLYVHDLFYTTGLLMWELIPLGMLLYATVVIATKLHSSSDE